MKMNGLRLSAPVAGVIAIAAMAVIAPAAAASAASANFELCAQGNYSTFAQFPDRGGYTTNVVSPGHCLSLSLSGLSTDPIYVYGYQASNAPVITAFSVGSTPFNDNSVLHLGAEGTPAHPALWKI